MLTIENLSVSVDGKKILSGLDLKVNAGDVHVIMGPNGSGKSTLYNILAGREGYTIEEGIITFDGDNLLVMTVEERARRGIFLAFQYPIEIPGLSNMEFMKTALESIAEFQGKPPLTSIEFIKLAREKCRLVDLDPVFLKRGVNESFSGGEKKRNELLQMLLLKPRLCLLDETDSGLDIDALKVVAEGINKLRSVDRAFILVTHYQRLLNYVKPDYVHVLAVGKILKTGDHKLALELEAKGYGWLGIEEPVGS